MKSIITNNMEKCYICGSRSGLNIHHVIYGTGKRNIADRDGLTIPLCYYHHKGTHGVHGREGHELDQKLKEIAEKKWMEYYKKTEEEWIKRYSKNYL